MSTKSKIHSLFKSNPPTKESIKQTMEQKWEEFITAAIGKEYGADQGYEIAQKYSKIEQIKCPSKSTFKKYWSGINAKTAKKEKAQKLKDSKSNPSKLRNHHLNEGDLGAQVKSVRGQIGSLTENKPSLIEAIDNVRRQVAKPKDFVRLLELLLIEEELQQQFNKQLEDFEKLKK